MEPTGVTWKLMWVAVERLGYRPLLVQPLAVRRAGEQLDYQRAKSDPRDAELICRLVRQGDVCRTRLPQEPWASLRSLAAKRWQLGRLQGAARQEVRSQLQLAFPAYLRVVRTLEGLTSQAMLRAGIDPERLCRLEVEQWEAEVASQLGATRMARWLVRAVHQASQEPGGLASERHACLWRIRDAAERWQLLQSQVARLDAELTRLLHDTPYARIAEGWRGLSTAMLANLLGLVGDPGDYDDARCLVRMAGLNPRPWSSGGFVGRTMISYAGRAELRTAAHQIVLSLLRHDPAFNARYRYLLERPERRLTKRQALCALAAKLLRTLWCLAVRDQRYDVRHAWPGGVPLAA
jgi:transposase